MFHRLGTLYSEPERYDSKKEWDITSVNVHPLGSFVTTSIFERCFSLYNLAGCNTRSFVVNRNMLKPPVKANSRLKKETMLTFTVQLVGFSLSIFSTNKGKVENFLTLIMITF